METLSTAMIREAINNYANDDLKNAMAMLSDEQLLKVSDEIMGSTVNFFKNLLLVANAITSQAIQCQLQGQKPHALVVNQIH